MKKIVKNIMFFCIKTISKIIKYLNKMFIIAYYKSCVKENVKHVLLVSLILATP